MAIEVSSAAQLEISQQVSWCATDAAMGIEEVATGSCDFQPASLKDMARGFSSSAFWLRIISALNYTFFNSCNNIFCASSAIRWVSV